MRPLRWLFTALVLVLIVAFALIVFPMFRRERHLVGIAIWATDRLAVEPVPYAAEDFEALATIPDVKFLGSLGLQDEASFGSLGNQLRDVVGKRDDLLALYLAAHGLADGDQASIVCSDFLRTPDSGKYPVPQLFAQLAETPAKLKLLILDCGRLGYDPRLGLVANEFPQLVARHIAAMPEQEFWVLLSSGPLERTAVAYVRNQTLFGSSVVQALRGAADRVPEDRYVTLFELVSYVHDECSRWSGADSPDRQRPILFKAGRGVVPPSLDGQGGELHRLVWVGRKTPPSTVESEQQPAEPPQELGAESAEKAASETAAAPKTQAADAGVPGESSPSQATSVDGEDADGAQPMLALLQDAWSLRDQLQASEADPRHSPIHFAPHVWREVNALLLAYEQRARSGRPFQPLDTSADAAEAGADRLVAGLTSLHDDLRLLERRWHGQAGADAELRNDVARRLDRLRQQALASPAGAADAAPMPPEAASLRDAAFETNRMVFHAVDYVRWHAALSLASYETLPMFADLCRYLETLAQFQQRLETLRQYPLDSDQLSQLTGVLQQFNDLAAMRDRMDQKFRTRTEDALSHLDQSASQVQIENDLQTPLLPAARRGELLSRLVAAPAAGAVLSWTADSPVAEMSTDRRRCQRVLERLTAECLLIRLADTDAAKELEIRLEPLRDNLAAATWDPSAFWAECRKLGTFLQAFYRGLPQRSEYRALQLVDPRDAVRVAATPPVFDYRLEVRLRAQLRLTGPPQLALRENQPQTVTVELSGNQRDLLARPPGVQYDRRLLEIVGSVQEGPVQTEAGWFKKSLSWQVVARMNQEQAGARETPFSLSVPWSDGSNQHLATLDVALALPQPNRVDLLVQRAGSSGVRADDGTDVQIDLFPNRTTAYQITLVNQSGVERQVDVALYAIPARFASRSAPGVLDPLTRRAVLDTALGTIDAELIARTAAPLALPADPTQRTPVTLGNPAAAVASPAKPEADAAPAAPAPPPAFEGADVSQGMLCVIRDARSDGVVWYKWIGWSAIQPRRFLEAEVGYDYQRRGIRVRVRGKDFDGDGRADLPRGEPVEIRWLDTLQQIPTGAAKRLEGRLDATGEPLELFAAVPADDQKRLVTIAVDGYPRGLVYEVPCAQQPPIGADFRPGSDIRRTDRRVRINRLVAPGFPYEFHFAPHVLWPLPAPPAAEGSPAPPTPVRVVPGEFVFVPAPCRELLVDFEVDAPVDAFRDPDHRVELRVGDSLSPALSFFDDRKTSARLAQVGDRGLFQFEAKVSDYTVSIDPGAIENVRTFLRLQMLLPGIGEAEDRVRIALDSEPPLIQQIQILSARREILPKRQGVHQATRGTPLAARIEIRELSGIRSVEYEFVDPTTGRKTLLLPKMHRPEPEGVSDGLHLLDVPLDLQDLPLERYRLLIRARDLAGHDSAVASTEIEFTTPAPVTTKGVIKGVLRLGANQNPVRGTTFKVTIETPDRSVRSVPVAADGSFVVSDLLPGAYNLAAQGTMMNRIVVGKLEGLQPAPPDEAQVVPLIVDYQR